MAAGCQVGALLAGRDDKVQAAAAAFGEALGIAFQLQDDYLGIWGDAQVVGKTANDLDERKLSLPVVLALEQDVGSRLFRLMTGPGDLYDPDQLRLSVEAMDIHLATERRVTLAAGTALIALQQLGLPTQDLAQFEELVGFVATRVA